MVKGHEPARQLCLRGEAVRNHEASALAIAPGEAALVRRAHLRSMVIACPDGCGDHITVNLDEGAGPAWKLYQRPRGTSLFPSVWRESGCRSHFIVWHNQIVWCEAFTHGNREPESKDPALTNKVLGQLGRSYRSYVDVASTLDEVPWDVGRACRILEREGLIGEAEEPLRGSYMLRASK